MIRPEHSCDQSDYYLIDEKNTHQPFEFSQKKIINKHKVCDTDF